MKGLLLLALCVTIAWGLRAKPSGHSHKVVKPSAHNHKVVKPSAHNHKVVKPSAHNHKVVRPSGHNNKVVPSHHNNKVVPSASKTVKLLESDRIINLVNKAKTTWKAGHNFRSRFTARHVRHLCGLKRKVGASTLPRKRLLRLGGDVKIPDSFDARVQWPQCKSIQHVRDQGNCGSCWAVASAAVFSDRLCIASNGQFNGQLSSQELVSCCKSCGYGCDGGDDDAAWRYFQTDGIVTGGDYGSNEGCQPYLKQPCGHQNTTHVTCSSRVKMVTPRCQKTCTNRNIVFQKDLHKVSSAYTLTDVKQIQLDIMKYGPIEAAFEVFEDFMSYKSGVYQHTTGGSLGGHAVRVIGWGVEKNVPYWLVINSWNDDWGDNGLFKIKRGTNECGFESDMSGGVPIV